MSTFSRLIAIVLAFSWASACGVKNKQTAGKFSSGAVKTAASGDLEQKDVASILTKEVTDLDNSSLAKEIESNRAVLKELYDNYNALKDRVTKLETRMDELEARVAALEVAVVDLQKRVSKIEELFGDALNEQAGFINNLKNQIADLTTRVDNLEKTIAFILTGDETNKMTPDQVKEYLSGLFGADIVGEGIVSRLAKIDAQTVTTRAELIEVIKAYSLFSANLFSETAPLDETCKENCVIGGKVHTIVVSQLANDQLQKSLNDITWTVAFIQPQVIRYRHKIEDALSALGASGDIKEDNEADQAEVYKLYADADNQVNTFKSDLTVISSQLSERLDQITKTAEIERANFAKKIESLEAADKEIWDAITKTNTDREFELVKALYDLYTFGADNKMEAILHGTHYASYIRAHKTLKFEDEKTWKIIENASQAKIEAASDAWLKLAVDQDTILQKVGALMEGIENRYGAIVQKISRKDFNAKIKSYLKEDASKCHVNDKADIWAVGGIIEPIHYLKAYIVSSLLNDHAADLQNPLVRAAVERHFKKQYMDTSLMLDIYARKVVSDMLKNSTEESKKIGWVVYYDFFAPILVLGIETDEKRKLRDEEAQYKLNEFLADLNMCDEAMKKWAQTFYDGDFKNFATEPNIVTFNTISQNYLAGIVNHLKSPGLNQPMQAVMDALKAAKYYNKDELDGINNYQMGAHQRTAELILGYAKTRFDQWNYKETIDKSIASFEEAAKNDATYGAVFAEKLAAYRQIEASIINARLTAVDNLEGVTKELLDATALLAGENALYDLEARMRAHLEKLNQLFSPEEKKKEPNELPLKLDRIAHYYGYSEEEMNDLMNGDNTNHFKSWTVAANCSSNAPSMSNLADPDLGNNDKNCNINFRSITNVEAQQRAVDHACIRLHGSADVILVVHDCYTALHPTSDSVTSQALEQLADRIVNKDPSIPEHILKLVHERNDGSDSCPNPTRSSDPELYKKYLKQSLLTPVGNLTASYGMFSNFYDICGCKVADNTNTCTRNIWFGANPLALTAAYKPAYEKEALAEDRNIQSLSYHEVLSFVPVDVQAGAQASSFNFAFTDDKTADFQYSVKLYSPIVLDFSSNNRVKTVDGLADVRFDLDGNGVQDSVGWVSGSEGGLLAIDLNANGVIDSGLELFGQASLLPSGQKASNGYEALKVLDSNSDGIINKHDRDFSKLLVWFDNNVDGVSQVAELKTLAQVQVESISLNYQEVALEKQFDKGNIFKYEASFHGPASCPQEGCKSYDVFFQSSFKMSSK